MLPSEVITGMSGGNKNIVKNSFFLQKKKIKKREKEKESEKLETAQALEM